MAIDKRLGPGAGIALHCLLSIGAGGGFGLAMLEMAAVRDGMGVGFLPPLRSAALLAWPAFSLGYLLVAAWVGRPKISLAVLPLGILAFVGLLVSRAGHAAMHAQWDRGCEAGNPDACYARGALAFRRSSQAPDARTDGVDDLSRACRGGSALACHMLGTPPLAARVCADRKPYCGTNEASCRILNQRCDEPAPAGSNAP